MGVTSFDIQLLERLLNGVKSVCELGAQNNYAQPRLPAPYMREWYEARGIEYDSIDLSKEDGCIVKDLSIAQKWERQYDLVTDFGTSEHVSDYYNCWLNKWNLCKNGGVIISENPKTGNWPRHGKHYLDILFYYDLVAKIGADLLHAGEHPAMGNTTDGWNIWGVIRKSGDYFPSREEFEKLPVYKQ